MNFNIYYFTNKHIFIFFDWDAKLQVFTWIHEWKKKNQFPFLDVNSFPVLKFSYKFNLLFVKYMIEIFSFKQAFVRCV